MRPIILLLTACALTAAEPDWARIDREALDLLQRYVRIASVNPPADTREAAALLKRELEARGIETRTYTSGPEGQTNLVARLAGRDRSKKPLVLMSHMDVVPADRKAWKVDPFGALIRDGFLWGRGSFDMKPIGVQQLVALGAMKQAGIVPPRDIVFLATCDEETYGQRGAQWMIDNHYSEIDAGYLMDEGGFGSREVFAGGKLVFGVAVGEKQPVWLRLRAHGTAAHGSQPIPDNANDILLAAIEKAKAVPPAARQHPVVEEMMRAIGGRAASNKLTSAIRRNTVTLTTLTAGVGTPPKVNVIPSVSEATLDCRLLPGVNAAEFVSEMKARINDQRVSVELLSHPTDPGTSPHQTPLFAAIRSAILKQYPEAVVTPILVPYSTDSAKFRKNGVPSYGLLPVVVDLATFSSMHGDAERLPVDGFLKGVHIYFDLLRSEY
ncbi:MAG: M20/M25/M40 family metallo-hydrolase [Acidobacteriales bacterium]|nr:M20/M25/M40 family metallo-hydrolase [Terriglobales bacterium]